MNDSFDMSAARLHSAHTPNVDEFTVKQMVLAFAKNAHTQPFRSGSLVARGESVVRYAAVMTKKTHN